MTTDINICNAALLELGGTPINSFRDGTVWATVCAGIYPGAKSEIMRAHFWNALMARAVLAPLAASPAHSWAYQFAAPGDWVRTYQVGYDGEPIEYQFEARRFLSNSNVLPIVYVADKPEDQWDAGLVAVMTARMRLALAYPVTKSASLRDSMKEEFYRRGSGVLAMARAQDGQENSPEDWSDSPLLQARAA